MEEKSRPPTSRESTNCPNPISDTESRGEDAADTYLTGFQLAGVLVPLYITVLFYAIDQTIIATAIPTITSEFHSIQDIGWYASAYSLATCACQMMFSRMYAILSVKWTYVGSVGMFQIGSVVCGTAPSSVVFITGRAISGLGGAGVMTGAVIIIGQTVSLRWRSIHMGALSALWALGSVAAPLLGGVLTTYMSWHWCFYISLPIAAVAVVIVIITFPSPPPLEPQTGPWLSRIKQFDPLGTMLFAGTWLCLLLALQWGGDRYPWSDPREISLLVAFGILFIAWIALQTLSTSQSSMHLRILRQRTVACTTVYMFVVSPATTLIAYYLPIWFQAVQGDSAFRSGLHNLPIILSDGIFALAAGAGTAITGYFSPFLIAGAVFMTIGAGLFLTLTANTNFPFCLGYQIIFGAGTGMAFDQANTAIQAVLPKSDLVAAASLIVFSRSLSTAIIVPVAQNRFNTRIVSALATRLPELDASRILEAGASGVRPAVASIIMPGQDEVVEQVLGIYNEAVMQVFVVALALSCVAVVSSLGVEWQSINSVKGEGEESSSP